jgi:transcriptional regulator with XRE-family HTH domain
MIRKLEENLKMSIGDGVGKRIREAREAKGINASRLAREAEVTPTAVWNWEQNQIAPRYATLTKVAAFLGVTEEFLRTGRDPETKSTEQANSSPSVSEMMEETRARIAQATGFPIERVKLHLEFLPD